MIGSVVALWRYPVKSMMGEELNAADITERGVVGDRAYAIVNASDGKVASAKHPVKWGPLFDFRAAYIDAPRAHAPLPPVRITLPDGGVVTSDQQDVHDVLSGVLGYEARLASTMPRALTYEEYWPDMDGLRLRDTITDEAMPSGTFFDLAVMHILTTATLGRLRMLYPGGRFEVRRFRPNIVVEIDSGEQDFVEDAWVGQRLAIGSQARLTVTRLCPRCVMTTLPQGDLPGDPEILRTIAQHHHANVGVYAQVVREGTIHRHDPVRLAKPDED